MKEMLLMLIGVLWILLGVLHALTFREEKQASRFELTRRSQQGDTEARELLTRQQQEPELESLRIVIVSIWSAALITLSIYALGVGQGFLLGAALLIVAPLLTRISPLCRLSDRLRDKVRPYALKVTDVLRPVLHVLRGREGKRAVSRIYSLDELLDVLRRSPGVLTHEQQRRLGASIKFDTHTVADIMTPKSMIDAANVHDTLGPLVLDDLHKTGHSRFPVIDEDIDHVVGMLFLHELLTLKGHTTVKAAMSPTVYYIRDDQTLSHALHGFLRTHHHLFIVVNEYRETVGLLALEDVIEALLGMKITDEFDQFDDLRVVAESNPRNNNISAASHDA